MSEDLVDGEVDEIPVVCLFGVLEIHGEDFIATADGSLIAFEAFGSLFLKLRHEDEQPAETDFVPAAHEQFGDFAQWEVLRHTLDDLSRLGHFQSEELIALAILSWPRLEETHEHLPLLLILQRLHVFDNLLCTHFFSCFDGQR